jgi:hypothetical protein
LMTSCLRNPRASSACVASASGGRRLAGPVGRPIRHRSRRRLLEWTRACSQDRGSW